MGLSGNLSETSVVDLLQLYSMSRQTAAVTIASPAGPEHDGVLFLEHGDVVDARFGQSRGVAALRGVLRLSEGEFRVELNVKCEQRTIFEAWSQFVLEEVCADELELDAAIAELGQKRLVPPDGLAPEPSENSEEPNMESRPPPHDEKTLPPPPARKSALMPIAIGATALVAAAVVALAVFVLRAKVEPPPAPAPVAVAPPAPPPPPPAPAVQGVTDAELAFGISAPFSGPSKELGREMKIGIDLAFGAANEAGGINGRKLKLIAYDDGYEPERTKAGMKELDEQKKVFGYIGNVGTPTAEVALPYALEKKMIFFGPLTGAGLLRRDPPDRYVFNYRAGYAEETAATIKYLIDVRHLRPQEIAVFAQEDGFGDAGYSGVLKMLRKYPRASEDALRVGYKRNTVEVTEAADTILKQRHLKAVVMVATYKAAAKFIEKVKAAEPEMIFANVSFVGSAALAEELVGAGPKMAEGVIVTQVVPLPQGKSTALLKYQELLPRYSIGEKPDFVSLEGYMAATLLIEGLRRTGRAVTTEGLVDALESMKELDLGVGTKMGFGMSEHQASHKVWGSVLDAQGNFSSLDLE